MKDRTDLFGISVEEEINHHVPLGLARDWSSQAQYFPGEQPPHQTNCMQALGIARNRNIHEAQRRISVAESDNWNIYVACLGDGLMIGGWIRDDQ